MELTSSISGLEEEWSEFTLSLFMIKDKSKSCLVTLYQVTDGCFNCQILVALREIMVQ